jgi:hypothetical protein
VLVACTLSGIAMLLPPLSTIDLAYLIRAGEIMLDTGEVLRVDPFGLATAGGPWLNQQWGSEVVLALVFRAGGWQAMVVLRALLFAAISSFVYLACRARGANTRASALLVIGSFLVAFGLDLRGELLGMALFALTVWIVSIRHRRPAFIWIVPAIVALWSNVHGSFFLGPLLLGLAYLEDRSEHPSLARRSLVVGLLSLAAASLNPFGLAVWPYVLGLSTSRQVTETVAEWAPTTIRSPLGVLFFASVLGVGWLLGRRREPVSPVGLLALAIFFVGGLWAIRGIAWWAIAVPPIVAGLLPAGARGIRPSGQRQPVNAVLAGLVLLLPLVLMPWWRTIDRPPEALLRFAPIGLTRELSGVLEPGTRMFNPQTWGSWFELSLPGQAVFVDSRIEVAPAYVWHDYFAISRADVGWHEMVERWGFDVIVAARSDQGRPHRRPGGS